MNAEELNLCFNKAKKYWPCHKFYLEFDFDSVLFESVLEVSKASLLSSSISKKLFKAFLFQIYFQQGHFVVIIGILTFLILYVFLCMTFLHTTPHSKIFLMLFLGQSELNLQYQYFVFLNLEKESIDILHYLK